MRAPTLPRHRSFRFVAALAVIFVSLMLLPFGASTARADVDDFSFSSWKTDVVMSVEKGTFGGNIVRADFIETITADFPEYDQNRGLVRAIPLHMGQQTMRIENVSVTDEEDQPVPFDQSKEESGSELVLSIGDDNFVHGETTYVVRYSLVNTMRHRETLEAFEFAPNLVPPYREQPIHSYSAAVHIPNELVEQISQVPNYRGYEGIDGLDVVAFVDRIRGDDQHPVIMAEGQGITTFRIDEIDLGKHAVTMRLTFDEDALGGSSPLDILTWLQLIGPVIAIVGLVLSVCGMVNERRHRKRPLDGPIITRYATEIPPVLASIVLERGRKVDPKEALAASVLSAALQGACRLELIERSKGRAITEVRRVGSLDVLGRETREFVSTVLALSSDGQTRKLGVDDVGVGDRWARFSAKELVAAANDGYLAESTPAKKRKLFTTYGLLALVAGCAMTFFTWFGVADDLFVGLFAAILVGIAALIWLFVHIAVVKIIDLTEKGEELYRELKGVEQYIALAEIDRLNALQSPDTADIDDIDGKLVVDVYEKLLPYAVLLGYSSDWSNLLAYWHRAVDSTPVWASAGDLNSTVHLLRTNSQYSAAKTTASESSGSGSSSSSSYSGGGSSGGGFGGGSVGGR